MKWFKRIVLVLLIAIVIVGIVVLANGYGLYKDALEEMSLEDKVKEIREDEDFVPLTSLPIEYQQAVIAVEDHRFKEHGAIDLIAIGRAIWVNITNLELREGGSTITQQVAKNLYFIEDNNNPIKRKVAEIFMAFKLESEYSKGNIRADEFLEEMYGYCSSFASDLKIDGHNYKFLSSEDFVDIFTLYFKDLLDMKESELIIKK